jgi:cobalamin biosynthesis Co2+ chelatase CbiK
LQYGYCNNIGGTYYKILGFEVELMKYEVTEYKNEKCTVRIHKPILTAEERKAREEETKKALVTFYKETRSKCNV